MLEEQQVPREPKSEKPPRGVKVKGMDNLWRAFHGENPTKQKLKSAVESIIQASDEELARDVERLDAMEAMLDAIKKNQDDYIARGEEVDEVVMNEFSTLYTKLKSRIDSVRAKAAKKEKES